MCPCIFLYCLVCNVGSMASDRGLSVGKPMTSKATEAVPGLVESAGFRTAPSSFSECGGGNCWCLVQIGDLRLSERDFW